MARDPNYRTHGEAMPSADARGTDPLAELARMIGQDDPLGGSARQGRGVSRPSDSREPHAQDSPEWPVRSSGRDAGYPARSAPAAHGYEGHHYAAEAYQDARYPDEHGYEAGEHQQAYAPDGYYDDGQGAYADEGYEEPQPEKRRGGIMTIAAVLGLAVIGTVSIFGYRAWTSPSAAGGEPPVIKAEQAPTKVIPAAANTSGTPTTSMKSPRSIMPMILKKSLVSLISHTSKFS